MLFNAIFCQNFHKLYLRPFHAFFWLTVKLRLSLFFVNKLLKAFESAVRSWLSLIPTWYYVCKILRQRCISLLRKCVRILRNRATNWPLVAYREVDALLGRKDHFCGLYNNLPTSTFKALWYTHYTHYYTHTHTKFMQMRSHVFRRAYMSERSSLLVILLLPL